MKKLRLPNSNESAKIKKELENIMKDSKEEYHNASKSEKESYQTDLGLQPKVIPENILRKGKEVLDVSGHRRRGSSTKTKGKINPARNVDGRSSFSIVQDGVDCNEMEEITSLDVMMKVQSVFKAEQQFSSQGKFQKDTREDFQDFDDFFGQYMPSEVIDERKPAIIAASNTTKGMTLATRKPKAKKYEPPKRLIPKKNEAKQPLNKANGSARRSAETNSDSQPSSVNFSVERNLNLDALDEKFYEILKHKLKVDIKENITLDDAGNSDKEGLDQSFNQSTEAEIFAKENPKKEDDLVKESQVVGKLVKSDEEMTEAKDLSQIGEMKASDDQSPSHSIQSKTDKEKQTILRDKKVVKTQIHKDSANKRVTIAVNDQEGLEKKDYGYSMDNEAAIKALSLPTDVSNEDIVSIIGGKASTVERQIPLPSNSTAFVSKDALHSIARQRKKSFLTSWTKSKATGAQSRETLPHSTIHHFCTSIPAIQLPSHLKIISRFHHVPDKFTALKFATDKKSDSEGEGDDLRNHIKEELDEDIEPRVLAMINEKNKPTEDEKRLMDLAAKILENALRQVDKSKAEKEFMKLQNIVNQIFNENNEPVLQIDGRKAELRNDETRLYWAPAPPKFDLAPDIVKEQLIPRYRRISDASEHEVEFNCELNEELDDESIYENDDEQEEMARFRERITRRPHGSAPIAITREEVMQLRKEVKDESFQNTETPEEIEIQSEAPRGMQSISEMRQLMVKLREEKEKKEEELEKEVSSSDFAFDLPKRRAISQPNLSVSEPILITFSSEYDVAARELEFQSQKILEVKENILKQMIKNEGDASAKVELPESLKNEEKFDEAVTESNFTYEVNNDSIICPSENTSIRETRSSITFSSRRNTRSSVTSRRISTKPIRRSKPPLPRISSADLERKRRIREFLGKNVRKIQRSVSLKNLRPKASRVKRSLQRRKSLSNMPDFEKAIGHKFTQKNGNMLLWIKDEYWYKWIDERYPPSVQSEEEEPVESHHEIEENFEEEILQQIEIIESPNKNEIYQLLLNEIDSMTYLIECTEASETLAIHLCRRGACYRKIGDLKRAKEDLERSIQLEPKLTDAHWQRHFLYLLQGDTKKALADLDYVLTYNIKHFGAYRSRAELYSKRGDLTAAIFNYSQAVALRPEDPDVYYARAYLFQQRGDVLLALGDFKVATSLQPNRTEGIRNIGLYHFENKSWAAAVSDFTALITQEPRNEEAFLYRGRASANLGQYQAALKDISTAIHLNPQNSVAFCFRGCLLRKASPKQALQDLSTSILLDHSVENVYAYLHRGILYTEMKRWEEAMSDFEETLKLDSQIPAAQVNLGLIYLNKLNNPHMAMRRFSIAIRVDPTYVRAHICKAEANQRLNCIKEAIFDYTRAIHLRPDVMEYRMTRGKLLMQYGKFDLASYHIKQCAAMSTGNGTSISQQAAVLSFLKNHEQAIEILEKSIKANDVPQYHILLGKTKMKANMFNEAIESFQNVLKLMGLWDDKSQWPLLAAEVYYLIGMAYTELVNHTSALDAFSNALKINPEYSQAYYQRGLTRMRLRHAKAIQDFNRALAFNPKFFQAYLSRAEYYGMKGRYAKAILNCNEAIRLKPNSIRGYLNRGALKYFIHAYQFAVKDLSQAIAIDPDCKLAYFNRAVCYQEMKHYQRALRDYGIVLLSDKKENIKVLRNRGLLYLETGELENALRDFLAATELEPRNPKLHHTLGLCYHRLGMIDKAVEYFSNALEIDMFFVEALLGRGNVIMDYRTNDSNKIARRDFLRAIRLDPTCLAARVNLAYSLQVQGRFKAAWVQFTKCMEIDENFKSAYEGRSIINLQMGNTFAAFLDINQALKIEATAEFLTNRGVINQFMGDIVNAMKDYQAAIKKDPSYSLAYFNAANLYLGHRQFQQALEYYDRAIGWDHSDESAHINRAITRVMLKNFDGALEDFNRAAELSPFAAHLYFNRGNLNASMGRYKSAEEDYTKALALQPGDALVYKRRADVRSKLSLRDEALADYKQAIVIQAQRIKVS